MSRARNQGEFFLAIQQRISLLVQFDHAVVCTADDEQGWGAYAAQCSLADEVGLLLGEQLFIAVTEFDASEILLGQCLFDFFVVIQQNIEYDRF